jgi:TetR/AcrR family transcriptional regulator, cholesterol catabolism regulator
MTQKTPKIPKTLATKPSRISKRRDLALEKSSVAYQERRREIAQAASMVFNKKGFAGTTLADIAEALGTDRATLYYYISNKEELFDEVVREVSEKNVAMAESVRESDGTPIEKLRLLIMELMSSYATNYPLLYVYMRENLAHVDAERSEWSKYMRSLNRRYEEAIISIVQDGIDGGTIRPLASARVLSFGIIGMVGSTNRWFVPDRSPESAEVIGTAFAELALQGLAIQ